MAIKKRSLSTLLSSIKTNHVLIILLIIASFFIGSLYTKVQTLEKEGSGDTKVAAIETVPQAPPQQAGPKEVSVDDDPVFAELFPKIKSEYIDTGKVKLVMRDLPLDFHQNAHKESQAAECAREQGGDTAYFKYHDEIFKRTTSNGTGLALDQLSVIANDIGLNGSALQSCLDSEKYKAEVDKDLADASAYGATGTPSFFIGKSDSSGTFTGTILIGAQPFAAFKTIIDEQLK